jgi:hypothetical protein
MEPGEVVLLSASPGRAFSKYRQCTPQFTHSAPVQQAARYTAYVHKALPPGNLMSRLTLQYGRARMSSRAWHILQATSKDAM